jgi:hypothetical protein
MAKLFQSSTKVKEFSGYRNSPCIEEKNAMNVKREAQ